MCDAIARTAFFAYRIVMGVVQVALAAAIERLVPVSLEVRVHKVSVLRGSAAASSGRSVDSLSGLGARCDRGERERS